MNKLLCVLGLIAVAIPELTHGSTGLNCQRSAYLKAEFGSITEPLYPDRSTDDGVGLRSCWFFNHTLKEDYIVGVELKSIDVGSTMTNSLWFSDYPPIFRTKKAPFCFLYIRANNTCSRERAASSMSRLMPTCRGNTKVIEVKRIPSFVLLASNVINAWRVKSMSFRVDYRFLPCAATPPVVKPGGESVVRPPTGGDGGGGILPSSQPCSDNGNFDMLSQNSNTNLLPAVIALAVVLGVQTMVLMIVIFRYKKLRHRTKEERHLTKVLHSDGQEISQLQYGQMQVQLHS